MPAITEQHALELLAESVGSVVGKDSEVYREMIRAFESQEMVDLMLAQSSFDSLDAEVRRQIADMVAVKVKEIDGGESA